MESADGKTLVEHHRLRGMGHGTPLCVSGPDSCGLAAPFMLDVGISSSLESAIAWAIADGALHAERSTILPFTRLRSEPAGAAPGRGVDVNAIITSALRSAGLMK